MKKLALFLGLASVLSACSSSNGLFNSQPSVSGTYQGTLTCADCEKIEAELVLNADNSYQYNTVYHFKDQEPKMFNEAGTFRWDSNKANMIYLQNSVNLPLQINTDSVEFCDGSGNPIKGDSNYTLQKMK